MDMKLPSSHQIGDRVNVPATVIGVAFTGDGKVVYELASVENDDVRLDLPSECVKKAEDA